MAKRTDDKLNCSETLVQIFVSHLLNCNLCEEKHYHLSPHNFAKQLQEGVEGCVLKPICKVIPERLVANAMDVSSIELSKMTRRKRLGPIQTEILNDLTALWTDLNDLFEGEVALLNEWTISPLPALEGATPLEMMETQFGRNVVRQCIYEMRRG